MEQGWLESLQIDLVPLLQQQNVSTLLFKTHNGSWSDLWQFILLEVSKFHPLFVYVDWERPFIIIALNCPHFPPPSYESELVSSLLPDWNDHSNIIIPKVNSFASTLPTSQTTMKFLQGIIEIETLQFFILFFLALLPHEIHRSITKFIHKIIIQTGMDYIITRYRLRNEALKKFKDEVQNLQHKTSRK